MTIAVAGPIIVGCGALVFLSSHTNRVISDDLGRQLLTADCNNVAVEVRRQLDEAMRVSDRYTNRIQTGVLPISEARSLIEWTGTLLEDLQTTPVVASICYGASDNRAIWLLRLGANEQGQERLQLGLVSGAGATDAVEYSWENPRERPPSTEPSRRYEYIATARPWYEQAMHRSGASWTPVYFWFGRESGEKQTGIGYTRAIRDGRGQIQGALVVDVTLSDLSQFLRNTNIAARGHVFIVDEQGLLVASSVGQVVTDEGKRLRLKDTGTPLTAALGEYHADHPDAVDATLDVEGVAYRVALRSLAPAPGINWFIVGVLPESTFMQEAIASERRSIIFAIGITLASLLAAMALSRRLTRPVHKLAEHVARIGGGDFNSRLELADAREFADLAVRTNHMAEGLAHRIELERAMAIAQEVQQSLLPGSDPTPPGLDIAGRTRYCDETGGDYFDFIDVMAGHDAHTLIAVGDVMGHGVASALLMASARAALRAHAPERADLADLLTRVNRVLAADARHNRFMTLALVVVDPLHGKARWASAGHDPTIVYHPASGTFSELEGSGIPLGIMEDAEYQQYQSDGLSNGDLLVIGTDGIWESRSLAGEFFGKDRLRDLMRENASRPSKEIAALIQQSLVAFRGREGSEDDVTFVVVKIVV